MRRTPPPSDCALARRGLWSALVAAIGGLAVSAFVGWLWMHLRQRAGWPVTGALPGAGGMFELLAAGALLAVGFYRCLATRPVMRLRWDGAGWSLLAADGRTLDVAGTPTLVLDWGDWMLLRWHGIAGQPVRHLPMSRGAAGAMAWHALRIAVRTPPVNVQVRMQEPVSGAGAPVA
ncbi:hypothetical protein GCM10009107_24530 [Ideonella azotifigens]|uniref:Uncharacterized protein n=3 Tax=Ideonella azotifigens TaxID=513160 RepID=A0ABP3V865_9BURK